MSVKVKRGLGLLVVAVIAGLVFFPLQSNGDNLAVQTVVLVAGLALIACTVAGLALLAWGLLRD